MGMRAERPPGEDDKIQGLNVRMIGECVYSSFTLMEQHRGVRSILGDAGGSVAPVAASRTTTAATPAPPTAV